MYMFSTFFRKGCITSTKAKGVSKHFSTSGKPIIPLNRALIVTKLSRYEYESQRNSHLNENQLESFLRRRGSDFEMLQMHHNLHKNFEKAIETTLNSSGFETRIVNRFGLSKSCIEWADVIFPAGGDGTFLFAASRILGNEKPVIGFNSDPSRSEGHLCLPKKYSTNISAAIDKLKNGEFKWMFRNRIRITLYGENLCCPPVELHEREVLEPKYRFFESLRELKEEEDGKESEKPTTLVLPILALNEVFVGENLSARVSYYELRLDGGSSTKVKSSGLCVSTGTGSTSWHLSINRLTRQSITEVAQLLGIEDKDSTFLDLVTKSFNDNLIFSPEKKSMCYTIRDLISAGVWPNPKGIEPRGFASRIEVRSRCFDAGLVVDGGVSFHFNDGCLAVLEMHDCDALRTVTLLD